MKKTTAKSTSAKTPAPATKAVSSVKTAVKPAVKKAAVKKPAAVAPVSSAPAKKVVSVKAKAAKATPAAKPAAVTTKIVAAVDVGFGNSLTIRGSGPGLSWEKGTVLACVDAARWEITLPESAQPVVCKFLINDESWCQGEDYTVLPGASVVLSPVF